MKPIASLLPDLFRQYGTDGPWLEQVAAALWKEIVGEHLARRTRPVEISRSRLVVLVPSSGWKRQLRVLRGEIVSRLNQALGTEITRVAFRIDSTVEQVPPTPPPAPPGRTSTPVNLPLQGIVDQELRARIQAAAAACLDRPK
ncbi:MAG: DUF721 domain-containing protein [Acidobacteriota bacterium]|nr:DUF721 domain-containing protein [Acidobacteriota bacterium]MDE2964610.1 DUF721 domain-containing protein [Acidobacteriota bacterium]